MSPEKTQYIFDLDHTLVYFETKDFYIKILDENFKVQGEMRYDKYLSAGLPKLPDNQFYLFDQFYDSLKFLATATPIKPVIRMANYAVSAGHDAQILTARSHFNCRTTLNMALETMDIPLIPINCAGFAPKETIPEKKVFMLEKIVSDKADTVILYEDNITNLNAMTVWLQNRGKRVVGHLVDGSGPYTMITTSIT